MKKDQTSLVDTAYEMIKSKILSLDYMPGQVISDFKLHNELDMSRTPIKQALMQLKSDGLIIERGGRGYEVRRITEEDVIDLFDAREGIECTALKIALKKGIPLKIMNDLLYLNQCVTAANNEKDYEKVFDYDSELHVKLIGSSNNKRLIEYYNMILLQLRRMRLLTYFQKTLPGEAVKEHALIFSAISNNEEEKALNILSAHILDTKNHYVEILRNSIKTDADFMVLKYLIGNNLRIESAN